MRSRMLHLGLKEKKSLVTALSYAGPLTYIVHRLGIGCVFIIHWIKMADTE